MQLILFTTSYPYSIAAEQTFLEQEIKYLDAAFERVTIMPEVCEGRKYPLPPKVHVEEDYAQFLKSLSKITRFIYGLTSQLLFRELAKRPDLMLQPKALMRLVSWVGQTMGRKNWISHFIKEKNIEEKDCIFYTYWFNPTTTSLGLIKREHPQIILVSRSHGVDLYEERHHPPYIPCHQISIEMLDGLFPASDNGTEYMKKKYPQIAGKCETAHLGVKDPGFLTQPSADGVFRIVSCSYVVSVKRLELLLQGIAYAASLEPSQIFEWTHFGDGPLYIQLKATASKQLPVNVTWNFPGYLPLEDIITFYKEKPIDVFMQMSQSEGGAPVSIQEAISIGIPIIATGVGGIPEILSDENGLLLGENPSVQEIADAIFYMLDHPADALNKKIGSRRVWQSKYNSAVNFPAFIGKIKSIRDECS